MRLTWSLISMHQLSRPSEISRQGLYDAHPFTLFAGNKFVVTLSNGVIEPILEGYIFIFTYISFLKSYIYYVNEKQILVPVK